MNRRDIITPNDANGTPVEVGTLVRVIKKQSLNGTVARVIAIHGEMAGDHLITLEGDEHVYDRQVEVIEPATTKTCPRCGNAIVRTLDENSGTLRFRCEPCDVEECGDCGAWVGYDDERGGWHHVSVDTPECFLHPGGGMTAPEATPMFVHELRRAP